MVVAAGKPVAEGVEEPPRQRRKGRIVVLLLLAQQRVEVLAGGAVADVQQALKVIDAGAPDIDLLARPVENPADGVLAHEDAVAQAERRDRAVFAERQDDAAFRIGEVDERRLRAQLLHLARDVEHQRQRAQREKQPARPAVLAEGVTDAVFARHLEILPPQPVAVDGRGIDDEARAVERGAAVGGLLDDQAGAGLGIEQAGEARCLLERRRIAADQRERAAAQLVAAEHVAKHAQPERHAGRADENDLGAIGHRVPSINLKPPWRAGRRPLHSLRSSRR